MAGMIVKIGPACGSTVVAGAANSDVVAGGGGAVLVYALSIQAAAATSTVVLTDGGVASGTNNRWGLTAVANGSASITFNPPLRCPNGLRITGTGAGAFSYAQWAKEHPGSV